MASERPLSVPEMRGMTPDTRIDTESPYSPESYAAQYGITVEDAAELVGAFGSHGQVKREIHRMFATDPELRHRALMLSGVEVTPEERKRYERMLKRGNISAVTPEGREW